MLRVPYHRQPNDHLCGPTALRMVFSYFGTRADIAALAKESGTTETHGTTHAAMVRTARMHGFRVSARPGTAFAALRADLARALPPIVNYVEPDGEEGHYAVLVGLSASHVTLHDPWMGKGFRMPVKEFQRRWRSMDGRSRRWSMTINARR